MLTPPRSAQKQMLGEYLFPLVRRMHPVWAGKITGMILELDNKEVIQMLEHRELLKAKVDEAVGVLERHYLAKMQAIQKANLTMEPVATSSTSTSSDVPKPQYPYGFVSAVSKCQTSDASNLCIHDALSKLKNDGDFDIGGTYADTEPEFWFFYTTSVCHGGNHLLNLFVCHRKTGSFAISVASSNELTQKVAPGDEVPHLLLPETMTSYNFKSTKQNKNFFIKTYCFKTLDRFNQSCTLYIPVKITVNPKFVLNINVVKSIKLQHDLSELLRRQETTDFVLESRTHKAFPTHKILLAAHSPVLRNMLKNTELTSMSIDISDNDMILLLQFIYTGTIKEVMKQDCLKLLEIADKFELTQLFTLTQHVIGDQITVNNAVEMAVIAKKYKLEELQKRVFAYIAKHPKVLETEAWNDLADVELTKYLYRYTRSMKE